MGIENLAVPDLVDRKGSLWLKSNHMYYGKRTLNSDWHAAREAEPKVNLYWIRIFETLNFWDKIFDAEFQYWSLNIAIYWFLKICRTMMLLWHPIRSATSTWPLTSALATTRQPSQNLPCTQDWRTPSPQDGTTKQKRKILWVYLSRFPQKNVCF